MRQRLNGAALLSACLLAALLLQPFPCIAGVSAPDPFGRAESAEIDRLVRDVCRKDVVMLGEDASHGGARTFEVKIEIMKRLVSRCGFGGVLFESQLYDLLDVEHAVRDRSATPQQLAGAIGALWSRADTSKPLIDYLYRETTAGRLRIGGIDPQVGGVMGTYSKTRLGNVLAAPLDDARRAACTSTLDTHNGWRYDEAQPFDAAARLQLRACIDDIRTAIASRGLAPDSEIAAMAAAYARYLDMALGGDGNLRDVGMYENLRWHRARWPQGTRLIVWCATVHAAKRLDGLAVDMTPMGAYVHAAYGTRAAVIGFSALGGTFGNPGAAGEPNALGASLPHSLEAVALGGSGGENMGLRYIDHKRLKRLGTIAARPINYRKLHAAPWADVLDGLVVIREERAIKPAH